MKFFFNYFLALFFIFHLFSSKVVAISQESILNKSQQEIAKKYAENYCSAIDGNFFEGLDNEKTLKKSYLRYMGFQNEEINSKDMYDQLVLKIRERCFISNEEEREINEFLLEQHVP